MTYADLSNEAVIQRKAYRRAGGMLNYLRASHYRQKSLVERQEIDAWRRNEAVAYFNLQRIYEKMDKWILERMASANLNAIRYNGPVEPTTRGPEPKVRYQRLTQGIWAGPNGRNGHKLASDAS